MKWLDKKVKLGDKIGAVIITIFLCSIFGIVILGLMTGVIKPLGYCSVTWGKAQPFGYFPEEEFVQVTNNSILDYGIDHFIFHGLENDSLYILTLGPDVIYEFYNSSDEEWITIRVNFGDTFFFKKWEGQYWKILFRIDIIETGCE